MIKEFNRIKYVLKIIDKSKISLIEFEQRLSALIPKKYYIVTTNRNEYRAPPSTQFRVYAVKSEQEAIKKLYWLYENNIIPRYKRKLMQWNAPRVTTAKQYKED